MPAAEQTKEQAILDANGQGLCVAFDWQDDRFLHTVFFVSKQGGRQLLFTLAEETAPQQMVTQEVHLQQATDSQPALAFLTGATGKDYWSGSIAGELDQKTGSVGLELDMVCRQRGDLHPLELTYSIASGVQCDLTAGKLCLRLQEEGPTVHVKTLDASSLSLQGQQMAIAVPVDADATAPYVARCQYQVCLAGEHV